MLGVWLRGVPCCKLTHVSIAELRITQANNDKTKLLDLPRLLRPHRN